jgi:hypothetical protein
MGINGLSVMDPLWATLWIVATCVVVLAAVKQTAVSTIHFLVDKNWTSKNYSAVDMLCTRSLDVVARLPMSGPTEAAYLQTSLAGARMRQGFCESAEELLIDSVARTRAEIDRVSADHKANYKPILGSLLIYQAVVALKLQKYDQAERFCLETLDLFKKRCAGRVPNLQSSTNDDSSFYLLEVERTRKGRRTHRRSRR